VTTDYQRGRAILGARLRELRVEAGLTGIELAERCGWAKSKSKVSKLETGRQTPTPEDLDAWAAAVGSPETASELKARLRGIEHYYRSWPRQLASGHRARQDEAVAETGKTSVIRGFESARIPGLFQTAPYARAVFTWGAEFAQSPRDTDEAVRTRMRRQEALYEPGHRFRFTIWEAALHTLVCPPEVMLGQLDRLAGLIGLDTVELGIVPLDVPLRRSPAHGFWIYDDRLVIVENINAEMWLEDAESITLYVRAWNWLAEAAVYGSAAHRLIVRAHGALASL
jgi:transcriptional regulator with XRE-family HTH domain